MRPLHPQRGIHDARSTSPVRVPGSVRRTSSVDATRPHGLEGPLVLVGHARDVFTPAGVAPPQVLDTATLDAAIDFHHGRTVRSISLDTPLDLDGLIGASASSGFRRALDDTVPDLVGGGSLDYWLLDEVPVITLVSGYALSHESFVHPYTGRKNARPDLCAGWRSGGTIMVTIESTGKSPLPIGPPAPVLERDDDPWGWHAMPELPAYAVRRRRLLDVSVESPGKVRVDVLFRDSHMADDGRETVVHEYGVRARVDAETWNVLSSDGVAEVLPWVECNPAAESASRVAGQDVRTLRSWVRNEMVGVTTCTHLNDTLRGLADVPHLAAPLL